tara:strand:- start:417 stop:923 length:507 start_codon:yes stop_codon:yes gene_type:complete
MSWHKQITKPKGNIKMNVITEYLYGAYGSNLNKDQMSYRCPNAKAVASYELKGHALKFRGVADVEEASSTDSVPLGLWEITDECEKSLDRYEGFPDLYTKRFITTKHGLVMIYVMVEQHTVCPPNSGYLNGIAVGYFDFKLDNTLLKNALTHSYSHQNNLQRWRPRQL